MLGEVHRDLPGIDDGTRIILRLDFDEAQAELLGYGFLNGFDGDLARLRVDEIFQDLLRVGERNVGSDERRVGDEADESAFELADVGADVGGDE